MFELLRGEKEKSVHTNVSRDVKNNVNKDCGFQDENTNRRKHKHNASPKDI